MLTNTQENTSEPNQIWLFISTGLANFVLVAISIYLLLGIPLIMRAQGWNGSEIGLIQLTSFPLLIKFILAGSIDVYRLGQRNYLNWSLILGALLAICLIAFCQLDKSSEFWKIFTCTLITSIILTWIDIPINAFLISKLPPKLRVKAGAIRSASTSLASIIGGGGLIILQQKSGWNWPFFIMLGLLFLALLLLVYTMRSSPIPINDSNTNNHKKKITLASIMASWHQLFENKIQRQRIWKIMFFFPFIGATWIFIKPILLDRGLEIQHIAVLASVGGLVAALFSITYGKLAARYGDNKAIYYVSCFNVTVMAFWCLLLKYNASTTLLTLNMMLIAAALGSTSGGVFTLLMHNNKPDTVASDYGLQSTIYTFSRMLAPLMAGLLLDVSGVVVMSAGLTFCALLSTCFFYVKKS